MLEGETDLFELISVLLDGIELAEAHIAGINYQIEQRRRRKALLEAKIQNLKDTIQSLMDTAGVKKIPLPEATVFISNRKGSWKLVDEEALPEKYVDYVSVAKPNRERIAEAVKNNRTPSGVLLTNGGPVLNIRRN